MNAHTPIQRGCTLTCAACTWRAIITTRGPITTAPGDPTVDHLGSIVQAARRQAEPIMERLRGHYKYHDELPRCDGLHVAPCEELKTGRCICDHQGGYTLSLNQLQRLYRAVIGEFAP